MAAAVVAAPAASPWRPAEAREAFARPGARDDRDPWSGYRYRHSGERYAHVEPNRFQSAWTHPLSTFGADVDTASYSNVRRFLSQGQLPPRDAVRVEEFVNAFKFDYDLPRDGHPIAITTEVADCPWAPAHKLVLIGARARTAPAARNRRPQHRAAHRRLGIDGARRSAAAAQVGAADVRRHAAAGRPAGDRDLRRDRAASRSRRRRSASATSSSARSSSLSAGGSTNGGQGLITAYRVARERLHPGRRQPRPPRHRRRLQRRHRRSPGSAAVHRARARIGRLPLRARRRHRQSQGRDDGDCWRTGGTGITRISTRCRRRGESSCARPTRRWRTSPRTSSSRSSSTRRS